METYTKRCLGILWRKLCSRTSAGPSLTPLRPWDMHTLQLIQAHSSQTVFVGASTLYLRTLCKDSPHEIENSPKRLVQDFRIERNWQLQYMEPLQNDNRLSMQAACLRKSSCSAAAVQRVRQNLHKACPQVPLWFNNIVQYASVKTHVPSPLLLLLTEGNLKGTTP